MGRELAALRGVGREYLTETRKVVALDDVNLTIAEGDYWSVEGASGSGKSTLLNILGLLDSPTSGELLIEGYNVARLSERERSRLRGNTVGFVFQSFHLFPDRTVLENVIFASCYQRVRERDTKAYALRCLESVGLRHRIDFRPAELSGGERQRVALARALTQRPNVLLCDEPTGNLDQLTTRKLLKTLADLNSAGLTVVVVSHNPTVCESAQRHLHLQDGRATEIVR